MTDKSIAIIQPYFMPYLGYFQLLSAVDEVVLLDNVQYISGGWINRNRLSSHQGKIEWMTVPLAAGSNRALILDRNVSTSLDTEKMISRITSLYSSRPYVERAVEMLSLSLVSERRNLADFLDANLKSTCNFLGIQTPIFRASELVEKQSTKGTQRLIEICQIRKAKRYLNPIGGKQLYKPEDFSAKEIKLQFLNSKPPRYDQGYSPHNESLSIIDLVANLDNHDILESIALGYQIEDN